MMRRFARVGFAFALGLGLTTLPQGMSGADEKDAKSTGTTTTPTPKEAPPKAPDFSKYAFVGDITGEIVSSDDKKLVLRVTWFVPQNAPNNRPNLNGNNRNFRNPNQNVRPPMMKEMHHDYILEYVPESLVRTKVLPPKLDDKGKRANYTTQELTAMKVPVGVVGYVSSTADLVPGTIADIILIRDKSISASKMVEDDLRVKYAIILGKNQTPPKDLGTPPPKKN